MEFTGQAFEEMQDQNIQLMQQLREKDDANLKLMSEVKKNMYIIFQFLLLPFLYHNTTLEKNQTFSIVVDNFFVIEYRQ